MGGAQKQDEMISAPPSPNFRPRRWMDNGDISPGGRRTTFTRHKRACRVCATLSLIYGLQGGGELRRRRRAWLCARISVDYSITALRFARRPSPSPISGFLSVVHMRCACFLQTICTPLNITLADVVQPQARHDPRGKDSQTQKTPGTAASGACNLTRIKN